MRNAIFRDESALFYELGYSCDNGILLLLGGERLFLTDGRYIQEAREALGEHTLVLESPDILATAIRHIRTSGEKLFWIDPKEWSIFQYERLTAKSGVVWHKVPDLSKKRRIIKRPDEIAKLRIAAGLGAEAFERFGQWIATRGIGQSERTLYKQACVFLSDEGDRDLSFDPIVAINAAAAKPHARPSETLLREGDLLLIDAGLKFQGYCSDRTRTVNVSPTLTMGLEQPLYDSTMRKAYDAVHRAQQEAIRAARPGMRAADLDALARRTIHEAGFGEYFIHSLGHGVGIDIHELPAISSRSRDILAEGMVFTIEPGIYIPRLFGIRLEEMVLLNADGAEVL